MWKTLREKYTALQFDRTIILELSNMMHSTMPYIIYESHLMGLDRAIKCSIPKTTKETKMNVQRIANIIIT